MRAQEDGACAAFDLAVQDFLPMNRHTKALELSAHQINAIQNGRGETMKMAEDMPPVSWRAAQTFQVFVSCPTCSVCSDHKIKCDRVQQQPCSPASDAHCNRCDYPQRSGRAPFRQRRPAICLRNFSPENRDHLPFRYFVHKWRP